MRALLQRVTSASVAVDGETVGAIGRGVVALVGIERADGPQDVAWVANRLLACRLWDGADGRAWGASAASLRLPLLVVSQFTLHADCRKRGKPDFKRAAPASDARALYDALLATLRAAHGHDNVAAGVFQAMMAVSLVNDGPVTVMIDSRPEPVGGAASGGVGDGGGGSDVGAADCAGDGDGNGGVRPEHGRSDARES